MPIAGGAEYIAFCEQCDMRAYPLERLCDDAQLNVIVPFAEEYKQVQKREATLYLQENLMLPRQAQLSTPACLRSLLSHRLRIGSGEYGEVYRTAFRGLVLKRGDAWENWDEYDDDERFVIANEKFWQLRHNPVLLEPVINCFLLQQSWSPSSFCALKGTFVEDPRLHGLGNTPQLYIVSEELQDYDDVLSSTVMSSWMAQACIAALAMSDLGVCHNDFHLCNMMYKPTKTTRKLFRVPIEVTGEAPREIDLSVPTCGQEMRVIDFGMSSLHREESKESFLKDHEDEFLRPPAREDLLAYDIFTMVLDLCVVTEDIPRTGFVADILSLCFGDVPPSRAFRSKWIKKEAARRGVKAWDKLNKNLYSKRGKYHTLRELWKASDSDVFPKFARQSVIDVLMRHFAPARSSRRRSR